MDRYKAWLAGAVVAMVAILALGWFLGVAPQLAARQAADESREAVLEKNAQYDTALSALRFDESRRDQYEQLLGVLSKSVPFGVDYPRFVGEVNDIAAEWGVTVTYLATEDAQFYAPPVAEGQPAVPATPEPAAESASDDAREAPDAAQEPSAPPTPGTVIAPAPLTSPLVTSANFAAVPVQLSVVGSFENVMRFVQGMQRGPRLFLVNSVATAPITGESPGVPAVAGSVTGKIGGFIYALIPSAK